MLVCEPIYDGSELSGPEVTSDIESFRSRANVIGANRRSDDFVNVISKACLQNLFR